MKNVDKPTGELTSRTFYFPPMINYHTLSFSDFALRSA